MNEIEQAIKSFEYLASGAPLRNVLFGRSKDYFNDICRLASKALQEQLESEQQSDEWISVRDKLPEELEPVMVCMDLQSNRIWMGYREEGLWMDGNYGNGLRIIQQDLVTHWMPLPEPPKEESE